VTFAFSSFSSGSHTVQLKITVDAQTVYSAPFTFQGTSGGTEVPIAWNEGSHKVRGTATWTDDGGGRLDTGDIQVSCETRTVTATSVSVSTSTKTETTTVPGTPPPPVTVTAPAPPAPPPVISTSVSTTTQTTPGKTTTVKITKTITKKVPGPIRWRTTYKKCGTKPPPLKPDKYPCKKGDHWNAKRGRCERTIVRGFGSAR
jgi:hypothetical protein